MWTVRPQQEVQDDSPIHLEMDPHEAGLLEAAVMAEVDEALRLHLQL